MLTEKHSAVSPGTDLSSLCQLLTWCTYHGNIRHTSGGEECQPDTSHLVSVLPFPPLPILWNVAFLTCITMEFHCIPQWHASVFSWKYFVSYSALLRNSFHCQEVLMVFHFHCNLCLCSVVLQTSNDTV